MPRKNPFPRRESEICGRLREFRLNTGLPQVVFARRVGVDSTKLAALEHSRSPLRYDLADRITREFDICQRWLATGKKPIAYYVDLAPSIAERVAKDGLYSAEYDAHLSPWIDSHLSTLAETFQCKEDEIEGSMAAQVGVSPAGSSTWEIVRNTLVGIARLESKRGISDKFETYLDKLLEGSAFKAGDTEESASRFLRLLVEQVSEFCQGMPKDEAVDFLYQVIHYSRELHESYAQPDRIALYNSRPDVAETGVRERAAARAAAKTARAGNKAKEKTK